jgi:[NiFe] hydrogenase assembly HybE family chaperone
VNAADLGAAGAPDPQAASRASARMAAPAAAQEAAQGVDAQVAAQVAARSLALQALFEQIAATRMKGVPILNPALGVIAVGFEPTADGLGAVGVLVTPWFMNLVWLPLAERDAQSRPLEALAVGATRMRAVGNERFDFIGAHEAGFGAYEACSLFSPMLDFADEATALATATRVLAILRAPPPAAPSGAAAHGAPAAAATSRRALLFGRRGEEPAR